MQELIIEGMVSDDPAFEGNRVKVWTNLGTRGDRVDVPVSTVIRLTEIGHMKVLD